MVFLGAFLAEAAGIEAIIGAFLSGLSLNRLIPNTSPLMNRIEFVGNALFIPFFLIGVGMLIDYTVFFSDLETIKVAISMTIMATAAKFLAAYFTQKTFKFSLDERRVIFGLSNAQAAATLAAVLVGYNIILNQQEIDLAALSGTVIEPIRLLNESILNGTIVMILVTCTIASFMAQKGAQGIALSEEQDVNVDEEDQRDRILIPLSNLDSTEELVNLAVTIKSKKNKTGLYALNVISEKNEDEQSDRISQKILDAALKVASSTDNQLRKLLRYDLNTVNGISSVVKEHRITDMILGLTQRKGISDSFLGNLTEGILKKCNCTTLIYKPVQPLATIKRHIVVVPKFAEKELGFPFWLLRIWNIARNTGAKLVFYAHPTTLNIIRDVKNKYPVECNFIEFDQWEDLLIVSGDVKVDDNLIIVLSRKDHPSFHVEMSRVPYLLNKYFTKLSYIMIYPMQSGVGEFQHMDMKNPGLLEPLDRLDDIGKVIGNLFRKK
jgi:nucleotide-binding universal stress UspA family protein